MFHVVYQTLFRIFVAAALFLGLSTPVSAQTEPSYIDTTLLGNLTLRTTAVDSEGNIYYTGYFEGTNVNFNPAGTDLHSSNGATDIFLTKYLSDGSYAWTRTWGGAGGDGGWSLAIDSSNSVYLTGYFAGTDVNFNPAGTDLHSSNGGFDIFLTKYLSDGSYAWTQTWGGTGDDYGYSLGIDSSNSVYLTGYFAGTDVNFNPAGTDLHSSNGAADAFLTKYLSDGSYAWTRTWGGTGGDAGYSLGIDSSNSIYVTGSFIATDVNFNPAGTDLHSSNGDYDIFLTKYHPDGSYVWTRTWGGVGYEDNYWSQALHISADDTIYITGIFEDTVDFDPGSGVAERIGNPAGSNAANIFVTALNTAGTHLWARSFGSAGWDEAASVLTFGNTLYTTGYVGYAVNTPTTVDFNPDGAGDEQTFSTQSAFITTYLLPVTEESEEEAPDATVSAATLTPHRSDPRPPSCSASTPAAPDLFQINTQSNSAHLYFSPPSSEHDSYYLAFGHTENELLYGGAFAIGRQSGVARIHVTDLVPNTTYYFTLRAQNDCMPGNWSSSQTAITTPASATYRNIFYKYSIVIDRIFQRLNLPWWWE